MTFRVSRTILGGSLLAVVLISAACSPSASMGGGTPSSDPELARHGTIEVTAKLVEIPEGAIFERELYNYATVLKYQVIEVHRGSVRGQTIYVGHYNPFKPRADAADQLVPNIGGDLKTFREDQVERMSLDGSMLDEFSGAILNKYFEEDPDPIYWAVWTDLVSG